MLHYFRNKAKSLSEIREAFNEAGFPFEREDERLDAIADRFKFNKPIYSTGAQEIVFQKGKEASPVAEEIMPAQRANEYRAAVEQITKQWKNAPKIEVVETLHDIPSASEYLQARRVEMSGDVTDAFFNPKRKAVVLVAKNIPNVERLNELVLHETVGHYGIASLFSGEQRSRYFKTTNAIYQSLKTAQFDDAWLEKQGYGNLDELAASYGFDIQTAEGKAKTVEEHMARLAELDKRPTILQLFLARIRDLLREVFPHLKWSDADILALLHQARRQVEGTGRNAAAEGDLRYSKKSFRQLLAQFFSGTISRWDIFNIGRPSRILLETGFPERNVVLTQSVLRKVVRDHSISREVIENLPQLLNEPVMVFDSKTPESSVVLIDAKDDKGKSVIAAVRFNQIRQGNVVSDIRSLHGRMDEHFINWINQGLVKYANKEKSLRWLESRPPYNPEGFQTALGTLQKLWKEEGEVKFSKREADDAAPSLPSGKRRGQPGSAPFQLEEAKAKWEAIEKDTHAPAPAFPEWLKSLKRFLWEGFKEIPELSPLKVKDKAMFVQGYSQLRRASTYVQNEAATLIENVLSPLASVKKESGTKAFQQAYDLMRKRVLYADLYFRSAIELDGVNPDGTPLTVTLPHGLTREEAAMRLQELDREINTSPYRDAVKESLRRHYALVENIRQELERRGFPIAESMKNPFYFPHKLLEKWQGTIPHVAIDVKGDFRSYLLDPVGSFKAIESDYLKAMYAHVAEVFAHNVRQDIVSKYWIEPYDKMEEAQEHWRLYLRDGANPYLTFEEFIEKRFPGYETMSYDPRLPLHWEKVIDRNYLRDRFGMEFDSPDWRKKFNELGIKLTSSMVKEMLVAGEQQKMLLPAPVKEAILGILHREGQGPSNFEKILRRPMAWWKWMILNAPWNMFRYQYGNFVSDLEKVFSVDPAVFTRLSKAFQLVKEFYATGKAPNADVAEAARRGVLESVTAEEVGKLNDLPQFANFEAGWKAIQRQTRPINPFWWSQDFSQTREATFRLAKYLTDLERLRQGEEPIYAGARRADVQALDSPYDKAARIANSTFVDYSMISPNGDVLRRQLIPFYSWMEGNFKYHANLFLNMRDLLVEQGDFAAMAKYVAKGIMLTPFKVLLPRGAAGFLFRLALPYAAVMAWNNSGDRRELEDTLSEEDRRRFHIILGKDEAGKTLVTYLPTALTDVVEWFAGNQFAQIATDVIAGRTTVEQGVHEWTRELMHAPVNKIAKGGRPEIKTLVGYLFKVNTFPDVFNTRTISKHQMRMFILSQFDRTIASMVETLVNKDYYAAKDFDGKWQQAILQIRRRDPEQWAYYHVREMTDEFLETRGQVKSYAVNNNEDAEVLRNFRQTIYRGDIPNAIRFYHRLVEMGYTAERFAASLRANDPLSGLPKDAKGRLGNLRQEFVDSLSEFDRNQLRLAYRYYQRISDAKDDKTIARTLFPRKNLTVSERKAFSQSGGKPDKLEELLRERGRQRSSESDSVRTRLAEQLLERSLKTRKH